MLGSKGILPPTIPDFSALRALEILKTFKIRIFTPFLTGIIYFELY